MKLATETETETELLTNRSRGIPVRSGRGAAYDSRSRRAAAVTRSRSCGAPAVSCSPGSALPAGGERLLSAAARRTTVGPRGGERDSLGAAVSYWLSAVSCQLSDVSCPLSAVRCQLSAVSYQLSPVSY